MQFETDGVDISGKELTQIPLNSEMNTPIQCVNARTVWVMIRHISSEDHIENSNVCKNGILLLHLDIKFELYT